MKLKNRYILKYAAFRFAPLVLLICATAAILIWMTGSSNTYELALSIILSSLALIAVFIYYLYNILHFSRQKMQFLDKGIAFLLLVC